MLNRKIQPEIKPIQEIQFFNPEKLKLNNGIPVFNITAGSQEVIKIDFVFEAGSNYQQKVLVAMAANSMVNEGTTTRNSNQIAEGLDFYGASISMELDKFTASLSLVTLLKYQKETLEIVMDLLQNATYPDDEFSTWISKRKQSFRMEIEKVETKARFGFLSAIFGENHHYGRPPLIEDYDSLNVDDVRNFYRKMYRPENCQILIAGLPNQQTFDLLNGTIGNVQFVEFKLPDFKTQNIISQTEKKVLIHKNDAIQCAFRIGRRFENKKHQDYIHVNLLLTVLGGYFGSRLMTNLREDKGYTYGIGSFAASYRDEGYITINSDVNAENYKAAVKEVFKEIEIIRKELIPTDELVRVKNYILGEILRQLDGPFNLADYYRNHIDYQFDEGHSEKVLEKLLTATPEQLRNIANKYLQEEDLYIIVAGNTEE